MAYFLLTLLMLVGLFLMFVILLQRGRGGGLAGAFGGLGGQSAFGTKAGDVFTVITVVTVIIWVVLACVTGWRIRVEESAEAMLGPGAGAAGIEKPAGEEGNVAVPGKKDKTDEKPGGDRSGKKSKKAADGGTAENDAAGEKGPDLPSDDSPTEDQPTNGKRDKDGKSGGNSKTEDPPEEK